MIKKNIITGIIIGLIANALGVIITATLLGNGDDLITVIKAALAEGFIGKIISLGAILNLITFFYFIKKKQDHKARGVLIITIFIAILTFVIKL